MASRLASLVLSLLALVALVTLAACKKATGSPSPVAERARADVPVSRLSLDAGLASSQTARIIVAQRRSGTEEEFADIDDVASFVFQTDVPYDLSVRATGSADHVIASSIEGSGHCDIRQKQVFVEGENPKLEFKLCELVLTDRNPSAGSAATAASAPRLAMVGFRPRIQASQVTRTDEGHDEARGRTTSTAATSGFGQTSN